MNPAEFLLTLGAILLAGLAIDLLGKKTFLPRVTLLLIFGMLIGPSATNILPPFLTERFELSSNMALLMIGFLLGGKMSTSSLKKNGKSIIIISVAAAIATAVFVTAGLVAAGYPMEIAVLLGCISSATDPAAILDAAIVSGKKNRFSDTLLGVVALDDAWGLILFSCGIAYVSAFHLDAGGSSPLLYTLKDIGGAILLGALIGLPASYLTGRVKKGQPMLTEALGLVFICGGAALYLEVSYLIASMVMGAVITNLARHHTYPFHAIEGIEWPFMVVFFVLAGASLEISSIAHIGVIGGAYILFRAIGKIMGAAAGCTISKTDQETRKWLGMAMLPQAGAAMGMALVASAAFPEFSQTILAVIISTTIFFELIGPIVTRLAMSKTATSQSYRE